MSKVNISYGFIALRDPECFSFPVSAAGLGVSGSAKGIAYVEEEPALVVERLDDYWPVEEQSFTAYQHIDDNWYVFFDYEW